MAILSSSLIARTACPASVRSSPPASDLDSSTSPFRGISPDNLPPAGTSDNPRPARNSNYPANSQIFAETATSRDVKRQWRSPKCLNAAWARENVAGMIVAFVPRATKRPRRRDLLTVAVARGYRTLQRSCIPDRHWGNRFDNQQCPKYNRTRNTRSRWAPDADTASNPPAGL